MGTRWPALAELIFRTFLMLDGASLSAFYRSEYRIIFAVQFDKPG
jgi:hypothetical protein